MAREGERTINTTGRLVRKKIVLLVLKEGSETKIKQLVHAEYLSAKTRQSNGASAAPLSIGEDSLTPSVSLPAFWGGGKLCGNSFFLLRKTKKIPAYQAEYTGALLIAERT